MSSTGSTRDVALDTANATALATARDNDSPAALPSFDDVRSSYCRSDLRLLDRNGEVLHETRVDPTRRRLPWAPLDAVSPALQRAVLASEDGRFYEHGGVDVRALLAAAWQRVRGGAPRGASTISMQLAAMLDPSLARGSQPRDLQRKWKQMQRARLLESRWTKAQILEAYLNLVTFRGELQGAAAASAILFDKAPHGLGEAEAAVLAVLIRSPNADPETLSARAAALLKKTHPGTTENVHDAFARAGTGPRIAAAPHAARLIFRDETGCADRTTTLDAPTQRAAADSLHRHLSALGERGVRDGAVLVVDNDSGAVRAYVASSAALSPSPHVDGIRARRQGGSTLKPFLYALALDRRILTASTLLEDTPAEIALGDGVFRPRNYDHLFRGLVSVRTALAGSLNVPAVRAQQLAGADRLADTLRALGMDGIDRDGDFYGPSLALGSAEVSLWELAGAYRALARGGLWSPLHLQTPAEQSQDSRVFGEEASFITADILADRGGRAVTFSLENALSTRFWSAAKTGTSKDMRDNWCVGFSERYTVGVWVGNFSGAPMHDVSGVTGAAPVWNDVMSFLHRDETSAPPRPPAGVVRAEARSAGTAEPERDEWYVAGTERTTTARIATLARILSPSDGSILTVDLDTPPERRRVAFVADDAPAGARWLLDSVDHGDAATTVLWAPARGRHRLQLVDAAGAALAWVQFEVRGPAPRATAAQHATADRVQASLHETASRPADLRAGH